LATSLSDVLLVNLNCETYKSSELNEEVISSIFKAITDFQMSLSTRCHRGYEDTIARIIREQLEIIFYHILVKQRSNEDEQT
ncbi:MAG: TetR/AcrR family transcriptional regulator, partial [Solibacillus isronensis]